MTIAAMPKVNSILIELNVDPPPRPKRDIVPPARFKDYVVDAPRIAHKYLCVVNDIPDNYFDLTGIAEFNANPGRT